MAKMVKFLNCIVIAIITITLLANESDANNSRLNCGRCSDGEERAPGTEFTCGQCVPINTSCRVGYYRDERERRCIRCPCQLSDTPCKKDQRTGEVICTCKTGYTGAYCDKCLPGYKQENGYPYRCITTSGRDNNGRLPPGCDDTVIPGRNCSQDCGYNCKSNCGDRCRKIIGPCPEPCPDRCRNQDCKNPCPDRCQNQGCRNGNCPCPGRCDDCQDPCPRNCPDPCPGNCQDPCPQNCPDPCPRNCPDPCPRQCPDYPCPRPCPEIDCPVGCPDVRCPKDCPDIRCPRDCPDVRCPKDCPDIRCPRPCPEYECPKPCPNVCSNATCNVTCTGNCSCTPGTSKPGDPCEWKCDPRGTFTTNLMGCICKANVEGPHCSTCKKGYFGLSAGNPLGCAKCFCSGVTDICTTAIYYRDSEAIDMRQITLVSRNGARVTLSSSPSPSSAEHRFSGGSTDGHYWVLPNGFATGNHLTSYGGSISGTRYYMSSSSSPSVPGDDIIIEGARGGAIFWSTTSPASPGTDQAFSAKIDELNDWMVWRNNASFIATRADILTILANVKRILIRASLRPNIQLTRLGSVKFSTVKSYATQLGITRRIEDCSCPFGYAGHSCESCAKGFYRDLTDMSQSVFGSCKLCPCGKNSVGCKAVFGTVQCICKPGFFGSMCQDRDTCSITMNPCRVRDCINTEVSFSCTYSSSRPLRVTFASIPPSSLPLAVIEKNGASITLPITPSIGRIVCEIRDPSTNDLIAQAYSTVIPEDCDIIEPPLPHTTRVTAEPKFICKNVSQNADFTCKAWSFSSSMLPVSWIRSAGQPLPASAYASGGTLRFTNLRLEDSGTYYCYTSTTPVQIDEVNLVVVKISPSNVELPYPIEEEFLDQPIIETPNPTESLINSSNNKIRITPRYLEVEVGKPVKLKCEVVDQSNNGTEVYWRKEGHSIEKDVNINGTVLRIASVKPRHAGIYHCIYPEESNKSSAKAKLKVITPVKDSEVSPDVQPIPTPDHPQTLTTTEAPFGLLISVSPPAHLVKPGDNVTLECESKVKELKVKWYKENGKIRQGVKQEKEGTLMLLNSIPEDSGWYICEGETKQGEKVNGRILISIKQKPVAPQVIISPNSPLMVRTGHAVRIECQTAGEPSPTVTWTKFVGDSEQTLLEAQTSNAVFEIRKATIHHSGEYFCTARNEAGLNRSSIVIIVEEPITCTTEQFQCHSLDQCIPLAERCNGEHDCKDGSDERHCRHQRHAHRH